MKSARIATLVREPLCKKSLSWKWSPSADLIWGLGIFFLPPSSADLHLVSDMPVFMFKRQFIRFRHQSGEFVLMCISSHLEDVSQGLLSYTGLKHAGSAINGMTETFLSTGCLPAACTAKSSKIEWATSIEAALNTFFLFFFFGSLVYFSLRFAFHQAF